MSSVRVRIYSCTNENEQLHSAGEMCDLAAADWLVRLRSIVLEPFAGF